MKKLWRMLPLLLSAAMLLLAGCAQTEEAPEIREDLRAEVKQDAEDQTDASLPVQPEGQAPEKPDTEEQKDEGEPPQAEEASQSAEENRPAAGDGELPEASQDPAEPDREIPADTGNQESEHPEGPGEPALSEIYINRVELQAEPLRVEEDKVPLAETPAVSTLLLPQASGTLVKENTRAKIDYSNTADGYVMVIFSGTTATRLKVQVGGPTTTYTYDLPAGVWTTFPLSDGNGSYRVTVLENTTQKYYAQVVDVSITVQLKDEFAPFLRPNQYVDYGAAANTVAKAQELAGAETDPLKKVEKIYDFVVENLTYDQQLADTVKSGYLPVLDNVLSNKKGICFDYASLMTGMLRSQGVPCKLIVGYVPLGNGQTGLHAWINVWTKDNGWVDGAIYFDGSAWQRMDPTFASNGKRSDSIMKYIGDGSNYSTKYIY